MQDFWKLLATAKVIKAIEQVINQSLGQSQQAQQNLTKLEGQLLSIEVIPPSITFCARVVNHQIQLQRGKNSTANGNKSDLGISGTPIALAKLALAEDKHSVIESEHLHIEGATSSLYAWQKLFGCLHIDWQYELAQRIGALPARLVMIPIGALREKAKLAMNLAQENLGHVLVWKDIAVGNYELDAFANQSHNLRARVERLQIRFSRLGL